MIINKVTLAPFGGVHGREVSFAPGLNVVLGANEAGKSTMVNALYAALFIPTDIRRNSQLWKDYLVRFLPYDGGDTMQVTVDFQSEAREKYSLTRSWGATRVCRLDVGSGAVITNEATVQAKLDEILGHGRGTYEGVLFARQEEMIQTVEMLRHNTEAAATLGDVLRAALMQAGGVSIDELALELASTKKAILDNWDSERAAPKNNRGVDRPYVNKVGRLLAAFYAKERLKRELRTTQEAEARVDAALATLESVVAEKAIMQPQKIALEALESDIYKRAQLEPFVEKLRLQQEQLKIVNRDWPKEAERNQNLEKRILTEQTRQKNLTAELELARAAVANKKLRECYLVANPLMEELEEIQRRLAELPVVSATDVEWLEQQFALISSKETELKAMKLEAIMTVQQAQTITVSAALNDPQTATVEEEASFTGAGRLL
ncbi:MAG: AAA family ATPase, partial [Firmicutes bacterium]|nr:AAA family ATPase [Bacillota bacterium]